MAKYKAVKKKQATATPQMKPGIPCLVIIVGAMIVIIIAMIFAMRNAG
jgi:hypothetical protein